MGNDCGGMGHMRLRVRRSGQLQTRPVGSARVDAWLLAAGALALAGLFGALRGLESPPERLAPAHAGALDVSVIVPARDEARNLGRLLESLVAGPAREILVVEGGSQDATRAIAEDWARRDPRVRVVEEPPLPPGWVGKCWACWVGRREAGGAWLLFTDADTAHHPETLSRAVAHAERTGAAYVTGLTRQELGSFAERVSMPPIFALVQTAAGGAGHAALSDPEHAIANGQFVLVRAEAYDRLGGHEAVKGSVVEDLAFARLAARAGARGAFVSLDDLVRVRMYTGWREVFAGWRKSAAAGASRTPPLSFAAVVALLLAGAWALPVAAGAAIAGAWPAAAVAALAWLGIAARVREAQRFSEGAGWRHVLLHPIGFGLFQAVVAASLLDRWRGRGALWKGRRYRA